MNTPHITKENLFQTSGHLDWFADGMFPPMELDGGTNYYLKPMNCPFHILIYKSRMRSYRELPLRFFEFGTVYRYEKSGVVHGLTRVRGMTQDDAHIFCTKEQMADELRLDPRVRARRAARVRPRRLLPRAVHQASGQGGRYRRGVGGGNRGAARVAALEMGLELVDGRGWRRVLRPEDLGAGARRDRPHLAALDHPARLPVPAALRHGVRRRRQRAAPAGHDPPRAVRVDRALLRDPGGALRGRVPAVARAGAGRRCCPSPTATRSTAQKLVERLRAAGFRAEMVDAHADTLGARVRRAKLEKVPYVLVVGDDDVDERHRRCERAGAPTARARRSARRVRRTARPPRSRTRAPTYDASIASGRAGARPTSRTSPPKPPSDDGCLFCAVARRRPRRGAGPRAQRARVRGDERVPVHVGPRHGRARSVTRARSRGLSTDEANALMAMTQDATVALERAYPPDGAQRRHEPRPRRPVRASPATCTCTSLPRWNGDTNFMTTRRRGAGAPGAVARELGEAEGGVARRRSG